MSKLDLLTQDEHAVIDVVVHEKARQLCQLFPRFRQMGFERVIEVIEGWLESGDAQLIEDDVLDSLDIQYCGGYAEFEEKDG